MYFLSLICFLRLELSETACLLDLISQPFSNVFFSQQISISQPETIQRTGRKNVQVWSYFGKHDYSVTMRFEVINAPQGETNDKAQGSNKRPGSIA
jgi:hypothetical protein